MSGLCNFSVWHIADYHEIFPQEATTPTVCLYPVNISMKNNPKHISPNKIFSIFAIIKDNRHVLLKQDKKKIQNRNRHFIRPLHILAILLTRTIIQRTLFHRCIGQRRATDGSTSSCRRTMEVSYSRLHPAQNGAVYTYLRRQMVSQTPRGQPHLPI